MNEVRRKLAAILSADVVEYSRLMSDDEVATVETLKEYRRSIERVIERHEGRIVDAPGDNVLAEFPSAVEAVHAAVEVQKAVEGRNVELPPGRRMQYRVGVNLGDVIAEEDGTIYGDGVNIAARMEALANSGGICVSSAVYDAIRGKVEFGFDFLGERTVKNIDRPISVYRVRAAVPVDSKVIGRPSRLVPVLAASTTVLLIITTISFLWPETRVPQDFVSRTIPDNNSPTHFAGPSIAVLPFDNMSGDSNQDYFADGLAEDIITGLSRFKELAVIARNSSFKHKGRSVDVRDVGIDLGVRYILEGSVRRDGDKVRVTAQLLEAATGHHIWSDIYDRDIDDIFALQDEITQIVVGEIANTRGAIAQARLRDLDAQPNIEAYDLVLRAREYYRSPGPEEHARARDLLEQAIEIDPTYGAAYGDLGLVYLHEAVFGFNPKAGSYDRAYDVTQKALALDPSDAWARMSLAAYYFFSGDVVRFREERRVAVDLNPNRALTLAWLGLMEMLSGDRDLALEMTNKAISLNPHHDSWYHAPLFWYDMLHNEARDCLHHAEKMSENEVWIFWFSVDFAICHAAHGDLEQARKYADQLLTEYPDFPQNAYDEFEKWNHSDAVTMAIVEGLRQAGLELPSNQDAPK